MTEARRALYKAHRETALAEVEARKKVLLGKKLDEKAVRRDPAFRRLRAVIKQYDRRIKALDKVDAVNADLVTRRAERAARPKVPKEKKKKVAAPKAEKPKKERKGPPAAGG